MKKKGSLIWITGLSGSGKSQVAKKLKQKLKQEKMDYLLFNGDDLRKIFKLNKYDATSRKRYAASYSKFCKKITDQGVNLMFAAVAMIDQTRKWNNIFINDGRIYHVHYSAASRGAADDILEKGLGFRRNRYVQRRKYMKICLPQVFSHWWPGLYSY